MGLSANCTLWVRKQRRTRWLLLGALTLLLLLPSACRRGEAQTLNDEPAMVRTPRPTFTPTPGQAPAEGVAVAGNSEPGPVIAATPTVDAAPPVKLGPSGAIAVVNSPLVNVRSGPSLDFEVVTIVERGQEFDILSKDALGEWWQVCCVEEESIWIVGQLVDTIGPVDSVPVFGASQLTTGDAAGNTVAKPLTVAADQPADIQFDLTNQERFPESAAVRVFMYAHSGNEGLPGYSLWIRKDGIDLPVNVVSFGGTPGFTWPFQDARQRSQNWKAEFPNIPPTGRWELQLVGSDGRVVGPPAYFDIADNQTDLELYVRYERQ